MTLLLALVLAKASVGVIRAESLVHSYHLERLLDPEHLLGIPALKLCFSSLYLI